MKERVRERGDNRWTENVCMRECRELREVRARGGRCSSDVINEVSPVISSFSFLHHILFYIRMKTIKILMLTWLRII